MKKIHTDFIEFLKMNRERFIDSWFDGILDVYGAETAILYKKEKDPFANPVGHSIYTGINGIYDYLIKDVSRDAVADFLDRIVRIRAVQDCLPSQAVYFLSLLKRMIREAADGELTDNETFLQGFLEFDFQVDELILNSLDIYMNCREKISELRVNETKNNVYQLLHRANCLEDSSDQRAVSGQQVLHEGVVE